MNEQAEQTLTKIINAGIWIGEEYNDQASREMLDAIRLLHKRVTALEARFNQPTQGGGCG